MELPLEVIYLSRPCPKNQAAPWMAALGTMLLQANMPGNRRAVCGMWLSNPLWDDFVSLAYRNIACNGECGVESEQWLLLQETLLFVKELGSGEENAELVRLKNSLIEACKDLPPQQKLAGYLDQLVDVVEGNMHSDVFLYCVQQLNRVCQIIVDNIDPEQELLETLRKAARQLPAGDRFYIIERLGNCSPA